jgi:hypothetical protein
VLHLVIAILHFVIERSARESAVAIRARRRDLCAL